jgi:nitroimidazol reductase NimA-like FMN-containing flavoprotein (pyridoxamine 5'-phosphate oxidase superfamily)
VPGFIPWPTIDLRLRGGRSIWIATTRPDGRAHAVPVWYLWNGTSLYFVTGRRTQKAKNLAHHPWVAVHAGDGDDAIIPEGPAAIVTDDAELRCVSSAYREKYVDPHSGARASIFNDGDDLYRVRVRHAMAWEYGAIDTRTDWVFEE